MPPSMRTVASVTAAVIARSIEPSHRGLPGSGGRWTIPISVRARRMRAANCNTRTRPL